MKNEKVSRRVFAKGLALAPLGLAIPSNVFAQSEAAPPANPVAQLPPHESVESTAAYNKYPAIHETEPFAEPLAFARREFQPRLQPFALSQVRLDAGPLLQAREWNRGYLLRLANDRLLHNFRVNAGLPSSAQPLGGWEAPGCELRGHFVGHYLSACAMLYAATADAQVKAKGDELVAALAECQTKLDENGYLSAFPSELFVRLDKRVEVWAPFYTMHKIMAGLFDMKTQAGNQQALEVLLKLAAWVDLWTGSKSEEHMQQILQTEFGGMSEVLYNLAAATGDDRWARAGDRFTKKVFLTPLALRRDELKGFHANTHMPQMIGAARRYELSSDARFANASEFFFDTVSSARTYATGGSGNNEFWLTQPNHLALEMSLGSHHQECCCAYNMMKLARHLYAWKGETCFIEYYERNLLNHRLSAIQPETGMTSYFLSVAPGAWKIFCTEDQSFWCCTGTGVEEFAKLNDTIYYHDGDSLYVNLFFSSQLHWDEKGIRLQQTTNFPESDRTLLTVNSTPAQPWTMRLRIPAWTTTANSVAINGRQLEAASAPGSYQSITRAWKAGDRVELTMPMRLTVEALPDDPTQQAFFFGPLVLAGQFPKGRLSDELEHNQGSEIEKAPSVAVPQLVAKGSDPAQWIKPVPGQPLTFRTVGQEQDVTLKPFNQSWERFAVYWTVS